MLHFTCEKALLNKTKTLKELSLSGCENLSNNFMGKLNLERLEQLNVSSSNITAKSLAALLAKSTCLKILDLNNTSIRFDTIINKINIPNLEFLLLEGANIKLKNLPAVLEKASGLKNIILSGVTNQTYHKLKFDKCLSLTTMEIKNSDISSKQILELLKLKNLNKLSLEMVAWLKTHPF